MIKDNKRTRSKLLVLLFVIIGISLVVSLIFVDEYSGISNVLWKTIVKAGNEIGLNKENLRGKGCAIVTSKFPYCNH